MRFIGGTISLDVVEEISEYRQRGYELGDFREAIRIADDKGVRTWRFLRGILRQREPGFAAAEERAAAERRKRKPEVVRDPERALPE